MDLITSTANPLIKDIRKLARRRRREATGLCLVEGIQPVIRALESLVPVEALITCPDLLTSRVAMDAAETAAARGVRVIRVSPPVFASISGRDNPIGIAAVARPHLHRLEDMKVGRSGFLTVLHDTASPGNLGTIVRTVEAMGGAGVVLTGQTADPFDPAAIRASVGTVFTVPIARSTVAEFLSFSRSREMCLVTTSARARQDVAGITFSYPLAVLLGSEGEGLPDELLDAGDIQVRIPMHGQVSSLNLSVAAGIVLHEVRKGLEQEEQGPV